MLLLRLFIMWCPMENCLDAPTVCGVDLFGCQANVTFGSNTLCARELTEVMNDLFFAWCSFFSIELRWEVCPHDALNTS